MNVNGYPQKIMKRHCRKKLDERTQISALIRGLPSTALFNVMAFDPGRWPKNVQVYRESLVPATESNKQGFESWIRPINESVDHIGLPDANYELRYPPIPFNTGFNFQSQTIRREEWGGEKIHLQKALRISAKKTGPTHNSGRP